MKKLSQQQFIERSQIIHNNKYDYSSVVYINSITKVSLICDLHGHFLQKPAEHLMGQGCKLCGRKKAAIKRIKNVEKDLELARKIHKNKYDYSLVEYEGQKYAVKIICPEHGVFEQLLCNHIGKKSECPFCVMKMPFSVEEALKLNAHHNIEKCSYNDKVKLNFFLYRCRQVHNDKYQYDFSTYRDYNEPMKIMCPIHGVFNQCLANHIKGGNGCPQCSVISKGELKIKEILNFYQIKYITQYSFAKIKNPKTNRRLYFDFYLPEYNLLIEYDGQQHFPKERPNKSNWGKKRNEVEYRDRIKDEQCLLQGRPLLRIKYTDFLNIEKILNNVLNLYYI